MKKALLLFCLMLSENSFCALTEQVVLGGGNQLLTLKPIDVTFTIPPQTVQPVSYSTLMTPFVRVRAFSVSPAGVIGCTINQKVPTSGRDDVYIVNTRNNLELQYDHNNKTPINITRAVSIKCPYQINWNNNQHPVNIILDRSGTTGLVNISYSVYAGKTYSGTIKDNITVVGSVTNAYWPATDRVFISYPKTLNLNPNTLQEPLLKVAKVGGSSDMKVGVLYNITGSGQGSLRLTNGKGNDCSQLQTGGDDTCYIKITKPLPVGSKFYGIINVSVTIL